MDNMMRMDRRTFACLGLLGVAAMGRSTLAHGSKSDGPGAAGDFELGDSWMEARSGDIPVFFDNADAEFQFLRVVGLANAGGAALGECITIVRELGAPTAAIKPSLDSYFENYVAMARLWTPAWARLGARVEAWAGQAAAQAADLSARDAYLRATTYYRTAEFFTADPLAPEARALNEAGARCFTAAASASTRLSRSRIFAMPTGKSPAWPATSAKSRPRWSSTVRACGHGRWAACAASPCRCMRRNTLMW